jgi:hypothetical protein
MKRLLHIFYTFVTMLLIISVTIQAQTAVSQWGSTPRGTANWPCLNTEATPAGNASFGADAKPTAWTSIKGGFDAITPTVDKAFVITGTFEFVGGGAGSAYTWLRYALFNGDGTLADPNTTAAKWTEDSNANGYIFTPVTGTGTISNTYRSLPEGNQGTEWYLVNSKSWTSTNSNGGGPISTIVQAPYHAVATVGVYDWAISVQPLATGGSEVRWYFVQQHAAGTTSYYWWGGSFIDPTPVTTQFNSIGFACNNDLDATTKQVNFANVKVGLGDPITVPEAPFEAFYINSWGSTAQGASWPILNDSTYVDGDAAMGADGPPTGWATIRGQFRENVKPTVKKALVINGTFEYVGGGAASNYTFLRYALTFQDSTKLNNQNTPTAAWTSTQKHYGYEFTPVSGTGTMANGSGGAGVVWTVNNGSWSSTWSNGGKPIISVVQAPYHAIMTAGIYDWAISVQPLEDGTNEVRWYLVKQHSATEQAGYWFGGSVIDAAPPATKFNGIMFGVNKDLDATCKQVNIAAVKVDLGDPIVVPEAPFEAFYVNSWGSTAQGSAWPILNDSTYVDGDAAMGADAPPTGWATIRGQFRENVKATTTKAIVVTGNFEYVGGGGASNYTFLRYALTYQDSTTLNNPYTPTAAWTSAKKHYGYEFTPVSGVGTMANGSGGAGTVWTVNDGSWSSTWSNNGGPLMADKQRPYHAEMTAGVYDWAISVQPLEDGTNEIRWYLIKQHEAGKQAEYWMGGKTIDKSAVSTKFNGIMFGVNKDVDATCKQVNITNVKVEKGDPIEVPESPYIPTYVGVWDFIGSGDGGWALTLGDVDGNVSLAGAAYSKDWAAAHGTFVDETILSKTRAVNVTGKFELKGAGFEDAGSLRFGLFDCSVAQDGTWMNTTPSNGYLFLPPSGKNALPTWLGPNTTGTVGAVVNASWISPNGPKNYVLSAKHQKSDAVGGTGTYKFLLSVGPKKTDGSVDIRYMVQKEDKSYTFGGIITDSNNPLPMVKFNSFNIAVNTFSKITALNLTDVVVDMGDPLTIPDSVVSVESIDSSIPTEYTLAQNYPNPFNPTTTIQFALPKSGNVTLVVYDVLGRAVANLVNENLNAGYHTINFNASSLSSGVYFYRLSAGDFVSVKKLMLLK